MKIDRTFLHSKVARRVFVSFILAALVPIVGLAVLSFRLVNSQLEEQSRERLHQAAKSAGMAIVQKLHLLDTELERFAFHLTTGVEMNDASKEETWDRDFRPTFETVDLISDSGNYISFSGNRKPPPALEDAARARISAGKPVLVVRHHSEGTVDLYMYKRTDRLRNNTTMIGKIAAARLWNTEALPPLTEILVVDQDSRKLFSSLPGAEIPSGSPEVGNYGQFEWTLAGEVYVASSWSIPLEYAFGVKQWTVVLSESKSEVLAPMSYFKKLFFLVILASFWLVALLSLGQIRRNLVPLERLREGTRRIAGGNFQSQVDVRSGDEFEELALSFNSMATRLGRQFKTLGTMAELDRAILSTWTTQGIVETVLARMPDLFPCDAVAVTLFDTDLEDLARSYFEETGARGEAAEILVEVEPTEKEELRGLPEGGMLTRHQLPSYLSAFADRGIESAFILPVFLKGGLHAVITLVHRRQVDYGAEDQRQVRQVADRVAVALSNARLLEELDRLNWGTLTALARTIDAKSPWTAGHSERAAELAVKIGAEMGLDKSDLDDLHRGALLHDIGKIALPPHILDKEGKLTDEELHLMQAHPRIGARILEPIGAYAKAIPVVAQHHEWWDGSGYPRGIAGDAIDTLARIYAVADVYDALISDRPYRPGMSRGEVIEFIKAGAGTQFAPPVVNAFIELMTKEKEAGAYHVSPLMSA